MDWLKNNVVIILLSFGAGALFMKGCGKSLVFDDIQNERIAKTDSLLNHSQLVIDSLMIANANLDSSNIVLNALNMDLESQIGSKDATVRRLNKNIENNKQNEKDIRNYVLLSDTDSSATWAIRYLRGRTGPGI